jgi:hypothetical protein
MRFPVLFSQVESRQSQYGYCGGSDSCPPGSSVPGCLNTVSAGQQSPCLTHMNFKSLRLQTPKTPPTVAFARYPSARRVSRSRGSRLHQWVAGSSVAPGRIEFVILRMDRSPPVPHGDGAILSYELESLWLGRTCTFQFRRAHRCATPPHSDELQSALPDARALYFEDENNNNSRNAGQILVRVYIRLGQLRNQFQPPIEEFGRV